MLFRSIKAVRHNIFEVYDGGAGDRFLGWKVYINGKKYPLGKGDCYDAPESEEGKEKAIQYAQEDILNNLLPNFGWVSKDTSKMSDHEWQTYNADRIDAFYNAGNKFKPSKTCSMCDHYNDYICLEHELLQLGEKGFL